MGRREEKRGKAGLSSFLSVFLAACLWGSLGIFGRALYKYGLSPIGVVTAKNLVAALGLITVAVAVNPSLLRVRTRTIPLLALNGLVAVSLLNTLYFTTVLLAGAGIAALLLYTAPVFVAFLSWLFLSETFSREKVLALVLVIVGLFLMAARPGTSTSVPPQALATGLLSGLTWALYSLLTKPLLEKLPSLSLLLYMFAFGFLFLFLLRPTSVLGIHLPPWGWCLLVALGLIPTAGAYLLYNRGLKSLDATVASIIATVEPVSAILQESFFFGRVFDRVEVAGAALILVGALLSQVPKVTPGGRR
jgi:DME family drug/metabolite transporter